MRHSTSILAHYHSTISQSRGRSKQWSRIRSERRNTRSNAVRRIWQRRLQPAMAALSVWACSPKFHIRPPSKLIEKLLSASTSLPWILILLLRAYPAFLCVLPLCLTHNALLGLACLGMGFSPYITLSSSTHTHMIPLYAGPDIYNAPPIASLVGYIRPVEDMEATGQGYMHGYRDGAGFVSLYRDLAMAWHYCFLWVCVTERQGLRPIRPSVILAPHSFVPRAQYRRIEEYSEISRRIFQLFIKLP